MAKMTKGQVRKNSIKEKITRSKKQALKEVHKQFQEYEENLAQKLLKTVLEVSKKGGKVE